MNMGEPTTSFGEAPISFGKRPTGRITNGEARQGAFPWERWRGLMLRSGRGHPIVGSDSEFLRMVLKYLVAILKTSERLRNGRSDSEGLRVTLRTWEPF